jgi:hypothetical protein
MPNPPRIIAQLLTTATLLTTLLAVPSAAASIGNVRVEFFPLLGEKTDPIVADYIGKLYSPPLSLDGVSAEQMELPAERLLLHMMNTIRRGTLQDFIALWDPDDQPDLVRYYQSKQGLWKKLQAHYNKIPDQRLVNLMHYGNYVLVQVLKLPPRTPPFVSTVVLKRTRSGLRLSNDLEGDAVHAYFATEFATRLVEEYIRDKNAEKH